jgi:hypothetical protein
MKYLYKYPQAAYPYSDIVETNRKRSRLEMEYELLDTGVFDEDRYFDVFVEYAKALPEDTSTPSRERLPSSKLAARMRRTKPVITSRTTASGLISVMPKNCSASSNVCMAVGNTKAPARGWP